MGLIKNFIYRFSSKKMFFLFKEQTIFPYYHLVNDKKVLHINHLYPFKNLKTFKSDLEFLITNYKHIEPKNIFQKTSKGSCLLTFDDGLEEIYSVIYPILKQKGIKAIFFINPDFVDNKNSLYKHDISLLINHIQSIAFEKSEIKKIAEFLDINFHSEKQFIKELKKIKFKERNKLKMVLKLLNINIENYLKTEKPYITKVQIAEMMNDGHYFGGHTMAHPQLSELSFSEQKKEIIDSIEWLKTNFKINYSLFAFPFSDKNISKKLITELFHYDENIVLFGNQGLKKDFDKRIIQRFSLENPQKLIAKQIVTENLYMVFNKLTRKYLIKRND
jgi:peptidoglycan/xylan/chitin deacetylase (PgdA/CDA1 family)